MFDSGLLNELLKFMLFSTSIYTNICRANGHAGEELKIGLGWGAIERLS